MSKKHIPNVRSKRRYCKSTWSLAERIAYYSKPDPLSGCHIWHGSFNQGYGNLRFGGRVRQAHRLAWSLKHGPIPDGMILCHRCDVRGCVNPDHLALGTRADNNADTKAARLRLIDARVATAEARTGLDCVSAAIRIFVHGVEMRGQVVIEAVRPPAGNSGKSRTGAS